ncbi:hypothetical protein SB861_61185, partial [Paraburkholderia sp. SIMBA_049]
IAPGARDVCAPIIVSWRFFRPPSRTVGRDAVRLPARPASAHPGRDPRDHSATRAWLESRQHRAYSPHIHQGIDANEGLSASFA